MRSGSCGSTAAISSTAAASISIGAKVISGCDGRFNPVREEKNKKSISRGDLFSMLHSIKHFAGKYIKVQNASGAYEW